MRIGIVSDTHGRVDPRLPELLAGCERILHAGDVMGAHVIEALEAIAPTAAVRGNNDRDSFGVRLPEVLVEEHQGLRILVIHELHRPDRLLPAARRAIEAHDPGLVVYGHSHRPALERRDGRVWLNPGSAGPRRFKLPRTVALLDLGKNEATCSVLDLEDEGRTDLPPPLEVPL